MKNIFYRLKDDRIEAMRLVNGRFEKLSEDIKGISDDDLFIVNAHNGYEDFYSELHYLRNDVSDYTVNGHVFSSGGKESINSIKGNVRVSPLAVVLNAYVESDVIFDLRSHGIILLCIDKANDDMVSLSLSNIMQGSDVEMRLLAGGMCVSVNEEQLNTADTFHVYVKGRSWVSVEELNRNEPVRLVKDNLFMAKLRVNTGAGVFDMHNLLSIPPEYYDDLVLCCGGYDNILEWLGSLSYDEEHSFNVYDDNGMFLKELSKHVSGCEAVTDYNGTFLFNIYCDNIKSLWHGYFTALDNTTVYISTADATFYFEYYSWGNCISMNCIWGGRD